MHETLCFSIQSPSPNLVWSAKSAVWSVKCEVWSVKGEVRNEKCEVWVKWEVWSVKCEWSAKWEVWSVKFGVRSVKFGVWRKQWEVWTVKCAVWSVKCAVWSVKCEVWGVECEGSSEKWEVWSAKSAVCSVRCGVSREGHGRDRVSLNYRSFMFGKLPPPACPGLCYMIMIWYINVYDGDDDVRGSKLGSIICLRAQDDPQSHWSLRAQVGDRGAGCGGFSCMVFELTGSNVVRKLGKHDFWSKIEHHHVSWFSAFWVPFQRSQNWIGFRENSDRKSLTFGTKTSKNHGFPRDFPRFSLQFFPAMTRPGLVYRDGRPSTSQAFAGRELEAWPHCEAWNLTVKGWLREIIPMWGREIQVSEILFDLNQTYPYVIEL